jgi:hypothetical protein
MFKDTMYKSFMLATRMSAVANVSENERQPEPKCSDVVKAPSGK